MPAISHHAIDLAQGQRRRLAHLVSPAQGAAAHHKLGLREKPVEHGTVAGIAVFRNLQSPDKDFSVGGAPDIELGLLEHQLLKAQSPQRRRRQCAHHARQTHGFAPLRIQQDHVTQFECGHRAQRTTGNLANANGHTERLAGLLLQARTKLGNSRHNPAVEYEPTQAKEQPRRRDQP